MFERVGHSLILAIRRAWPIVGIRDASKLRLRHTHRRNKITAMQDQQLDGIDFRYVPESCQGPVRDWFAGRLAAIAIDGTRSVHLPHPSGGGRILKVKGAGYAGGAVEFGTYHNTGPKAPVFDYEGRMMEDVAAGWDGAFEGGASFQQAATEYRVTQRLSERGYAIIPCLGYGRISKNGLSSWFSVFDHEPGLRVDSSMMYPGMGIEDGNTSIRRSAN